MYGIPVWTEKNRLHFGPNTITYFGSPNGYNFRNATDGDILTINNNGDLNITGTYKVNNVSLTSYFNKTYGPLSGTRTFLSPYYFYEYNISSVNSINTLGQNMRIIEVIVYDSTDWGDTSVVYGRFNIRISDYAGFKQSSFTIQTAGTVSCSAINYNTIRVATTRSNYPLVIINSLIP